jgi:Txe/YoeB family toxin of toxin-antitoxin system
MVKYKLYFTKQAQKDAKRINQAGLKNQVIKLLNILESKPFSRYPPFEKLLGDLTGAYSRRINLQHRLVYQIYEKEKVIKIIRMWTHYEE